MSSVLQYWRQLVESGIVPSGSDTTIAFALPADTLPPAIAAVSAIGIAVSRFALQDHTHAHGDLLGGALHSAVSTTESGFAPVITGADGAVLTKSGAAAVWATPVGSGSTVLTPEDYGAVRDGATDDSTAFALVTAEAYTTGYPVQLSRGTYRLNSTWVINAPITVRGVGRGNGNNTILRFRNGIDGIRIDYRDGPVGGGGSRAHLSDFLVTTVGGITAFAPSTFSIPGVSVFRPSTGYAGYIYDVTAQGTTGSEPVWPTTEGDTVVTGTVTMVTRYVAGIKCLSNGVQVERVTITAFPGDGFSIFASTGDGDNGNTGRVDNVRCDSSIGYGFFAQGADSNWWTITHLDVTANALGGVRDQSFLGNNYYSCHADANGGRPFMNVGASNRTTFMQCYIEGGQAAALVDGNGVWFGSSVGGAIEGTGQRYTPELGWNTMQLISSTGANMLLMRTGTNSVLEFGANGDGGRVYQLHYEGLGQVGWWQNVYGGATSAYNLSTALAPEGGAQIWFPQGFYAGGTDYKIKIGWGDAAPTTGTHLYGSIVYRRAAVDNIFGWICTAAGTPGTWVPMYRFGNISTATILGRTTAGTGEPEQLTATQATAMLNSFAGSIKGLVPVSTGLTTTFLRGDGVWAVPPGGGGGGGDALTGNPLSQFAATTSAQLASIMTDETGTGALVFATSPTLVTPNIGNATGNISGNAATVTTNANLTGVVTSVGNATAIANGAIALAKLANGTAGQIPTWDAAGVIAAVATGTSGHVLTSNGAGAAPTFQAPAGGAGAPADAQYLTLALDGTLTDERVLTPESGVLSIADAGAGSTATLSIVTAGVAPTKLTNAWARATATITLAVNASTGSDTADVNRPAILLAGDYSAYPFATVQAALDALPKNLGRFDHRVTVTAAAYAGWLADGFQGSGSLDIVGTQSLATLASGANTGTADTGTTSTAVKKPAAAANWTVDDLRGKILVVTGGGGYYADTADNVAFFGPCQRVIKGNTVDTLDIEELNGVDATTTYDIREPGTLYDAAATTLNGLTYCVGVMRNSARILVRNASPNDGGVYYGVLADASDQLSIYGCKFGTTTYSMWSVSNSYVTFGHNYVAGTLGSDAYFTDCKKLFMTGIVADSGQMRVAHIQDALIAVDARGYQSAVLDLDDMQYCSLTLNATGCTVTPLELTNISEMDGLLTGANASASYGLVISGAGRYNVNGSTLGGAADISFNGLAHTWANLAARGYITRIGATLFWATAGSEVVNRTSDLTLTAEMVGGVWTNRGASGAIALTMPASAALRAGDRFRFRVAANQYLRINAVGSDTLRFAGLVSGAAGYIRSTDIGDCLEIEYQGSGEFYVTAGFGNWSIDI